MDNQPWSKKQIKSSRKMHQDSFMFAGFGYWDMKKGREWVKWSSLKQRQIRHFGKNGR
jgi:hypothetical protein